MWGGPAVLVAFEDICPFALHCLALHTGLAHPVVLRLDWHSHFAGAAFFGGVLVWCAGSLVNSRTSAYINAVQCTATHTEMSQASPARAHLGALAASHLEGTRYQVPVSVPLRYEAHAIVDAESCCACAHTRTVVAQVFKGF